MIYYNQAFRSEADAKAFVAAEMRRYHPCGYGTALKITCADEGLWLVTGSRQRSCD
jgi:hypothetical protein